MVTFSEPYASMGKVIANVSKRTPKSVWERYFLQSRIVVILLLQTCLVIMAYYCSFLLRFDFMFDTATRALLWKTVMVVLVIKLLLFKKFGLLRGWWQYVGMSDLLDISKAA